MICDSFYAARVFRYPGEPNRKYHLRSRSKRSLHSTTVVLSLTHILFIEFTDAIAEDWGGKPFVDLQKGWNYVLNEYPEVSATFESELAF